MIPIMKPSLPTADSLLPYLRCIDESRWYSNYGPLNEEYERRLSELFKCHVTTCSSGTSGLIAALTASLPFNHDRRAKVGMPSWTFAATASAVYAAGFSPFMCDVFEDDIIALSGTSGCEAFVPVAPLGKPLDLFFWDEFINVDKRTPVVIDAAAGFDSFQSLAIGESPVVISTHCTKVFGTGEGGIVLSQDKELIDKIRRITNHGMLPDKTVVELGINAKLSEYHAAVGLAELDGWKSKRWKWLKIQEWYGDETPYATSTHSVLLDRPAAPLVAKLAERGVQARASWYGTCHKQEAFVQNSKHMPMTRTDMLAERTIFLPKFIGMKPQNVEYILTTLKRCL